MDTTCPRGVDAGPCGGISNRHPALPPLGLIVDGVKTEIRRINVRCLPRAWLLDELFVTTLASQE
ncbi:hypothetical protein Mycsm_01583 [Mycobacterium sp. JS623]|nr:hypothetical protein Mycsm_01583 [Mycobacterium sp. JS623]